MCNEGRDGTSLTCFQISLLEEIVCSASEPLHEGPATTILELSAYGLMWYLSLSIEKSDRTTVFASKLRGHYSASQS